MLKIAEKLDFRRGQGLRCIKETIISRQIRFLRLLWLKYFFKKVKILTFQDKFDILSEMRFSGVTEQ